jgi:hypothetical protein
MQKRERSASLASISEVHELTELGLAAAAAARAAAGCQPSHGRSSESRGAPNPAIWSKAEPIIAIESKQIRAK